MWSLDTSGIVVACGCAIAVGFWWREHVEPVAVIPEGSWDEAPGSAAGPCTERYMSCTAILPLIFVASRGWTLCKFCCPTKFWKIYIVKIGQFDFVSVSRVQSAIHRPQHILQMFSKQLIWFNKYSNLNFKVRFFKRMCTEFPRITNQTLHRYIEPQLCKVRLWHVLINLAEVACGPRCWKNIFFYF